MKKIICFFLLAGTSSLLAQSKTIVAISGEKVTYPTASANTLSTASNTITSNVNGVLSSAVGVNAVSNTIAGAMLGTNVNGVAGAVIDISSLEPWRIQGSATPSTSNMDNIYQLGKMTVGATAPLAGNTKELAVYGHASISKTIGIDMLDTSDGTLRSSLIFGTMLTGEAISSNRTTPANGNLKGLDFWTSSNRRMSITANGNIGIGNAVPTSKLEIISGSPNGLKIVDGSQALGRVLTSDGTGLASWKFPRVLVVSKEGVLPLAQVDFSASGDNALGGYIDLVPGSWIVYIGLEINPKTGQTDTSPNAAYGARFGLSISDTALDSTGITYLGPNVVVNYRSTSVNVSKYPMYVSGCLRVTTTAVSTRLYLWNVGSVGGTNGGSEIGSVTNDPENYFYALRMQ